jgi:hypothetical protein
MVRLRPFQACQAIYQQAAAPHSSAKTIRSPPRHALDGIYLLRTSLPENTFADDGVVAPSQGPEDAERFLPLHGHPFGMPPIRSGDQARLDTG